MKELLNTGVIDVSPQKKDWFATGETGIKYEDRGVNWKEYLPTGENQYKPKKRGSLVALYDTDSCVSFSYLNAIEAQINWMIDKDKMPPETLKWLIQEGYVIDGQCNFSDRFLAKMSGTIKGWGNSLPHVAETARKVGLLPEKDWAFEGDTWDEYMKEIPQELKDKALKFLEYFDLAYDWVWNGGSNADRKEVFEYYTKHAPVQISAPVCPMWSRFSLKNEIIKGCPLNGGGHATIIYGVKDYYNCFDHYEPFSKRLALDYPIRAGLRMLIEPKKVIEIPKVTHIFNVDMKKGDRNNEVKKLQQWLIDKNFLKPRLDTGFYGDLTSMAVRQLQRTHKITTTWEDWRWKGEHCGPKTRSFINKVILNGNVLDGQ